MGHPGRDLWPGRQPSSIGAISLEWTRHSSFAFHALAMSVLILTCLVLKATTIEIAAIYRACTMCQGQSAFYYCYPTQHPSKVGVLSLFSK